MAGPPIRQQTNKGHTARPKCWLPRTAIIARTRLYKTRTDWDFEMETNFRKRGLNPIKTLLKTSEVHTKTP